VQELHDFSFERSRGIVWVCDLVNSAKYLNDNACAGDLEEFLPRLHWAGMIATEAATGRFLKWTGDGFLAWFETPLYREIGQKAATIFQVIWHLSFMVNVTQLAVKSSKRFIVRHGIAFEHDALVTNIKDAKGHETLDITGRGVVLAFKLSGIRASFPGLVTEGSLVKSAREFGYKSTEFKAWIPSDEDRLRFFKGERYGTRNLYISTDKKPRQKSLNSTLKHTKRIIDEVESKSIVPTGELDVGSRFCSMMSNGPSWAKAAIAKEHQFIEKDILGGLKSFVTAHKTGAGNHSRGKRQGK
jgi:hypothetical protein